VKVAQKVAAPKPAAPPPPEMFNVEVIRGDKKEESKFQTSK
jgi:hypothetical protein